MEIKIGFLISFDYQFLRNSLPLIYNEATSISLAIDKNRKTWSGGSYSLPDSFFQWLKDLLPSINPTAS